MVRRWVDPDQPNPKWGIAPPRGVAWATCAASAARVRLESVTSDREVIAGFERLVKNRDVDDAFLAAVCKRRISLDYLFLGKGEPFMSEAL